MPTVWLLAFIALPFGLAGAVAMALPYPTVLRYAHVVLASGLCWMTVGLLAHAGLL